MNSNTLNKKDEAIEKRIEAEINEKMMNRLKERKNKSEEFEIFEVKENFYLSPVKKYLKYKEKKRKYKNIYQQSALKYYFNIKLHLIWKFIKKNLFRQIIVTAMFSFSLYFFYNWGIKDKLTNWIKPVWYKLKGMFSFFSRKKMVNVETIQ